MYGWSGSWRESLFEHATASSSTGPKLGVNYVQASAPSTTLELRAASSSLVVGQDLAKHGIAGVVWNCARAMVSFFEAEPQLAAHRHVLELGAGPGAVGLALASACKVSSLLLTDLESVVPLIRSNARSAAQHHDSIATLTASNRLDIRALCWGEPLDDTIARRPVDVVVASDCTYDSASHSALLATLLELTGTSSISEQAQRHPVVLLAYKQRMPGKEHVFFTSAAMHFDIAVYSSDSSTSSTSNSNNFGSAIEFYDEAIYICKLERRRNEREPEAGTPA
ncbi:hypothetical protein PHYPSEUDO_007818 [Phytophthora pseudosyringae]|uniref:Uncharacterized protein n=1 Tax=Phytophthora pseudosyringae TaxID=221518 RepID=A0A8T1VFQ3_9STRA|nr:hypothetical protein PHYPSEUDO_007818 [Phytophthora pseudosyringae]